MNLSGQVVVVTGSTRGIGKACAEALARQGANVVITGRNEAAAQAVAQSLVQSYGVKAIGVALEANNFDDVQATFQTILGQMERIDVLVNNAGITEDNLLLRMTEDQWDRVIETNLKSAFNCTKAVLRAMLKQKGGKIINMSSVVGVMGNAGQANYAASKAGLIGFTKSIAREYGAKGIIANAIAPGFIETEMLESLPKEYLDNIIAQIPEKRLGRPDEVGQLVCFLASSVSDYITGQVITIDGGLHI